MDEIRCGEPGCGEMASTESIVEMANLTGGMMTGLFPHPREYSCPAGHRTTIRDEVAHLRDELEGKRHPSRDSAEDGRE